MHSASAKMLQPSDSYWFDTRRDDLSERQPDARKSCLRRCRPNNRNDHASFTGSNTSPQSAGNQCQRQLLLAGALFHFDRHSGSGRISNRPQANVTALSPASPPAPRIKKARTQSPGWLHEEENSALRVVHSSVFSRPAQDGTRIEAAFSQRNYRAAIAGILYRDRTGCSVSFRDHSIRDSDARNPAIVQQRRRLPSR